MSDGLRILGEANSVTNPGVDPRKFRGRAALVTLGCAKNQVDSEVMLGVLAKNGFEIVDTPANADVAIVNTCGFLQSAATESVDRILELAELKKNGRLRQLIVAGCLVERYRGDLRASLPEVDEFITTQDLLKVGEVALGAHGDFLSRAERPYFLYDDSTPRCLSTGSHTAYVKIAEGCDRPCTFCIIPKIRGAMRSRKIDSVVREVVALRAQGVREVNLLAQDLTSFGRDTKEGTLADLLQRLERETEIDWIRLLYAYPIGVDQRLLQTIVESKRVCEYLDIPLQHASEAVLARMKRPLGRYAPRALVEFIRKEAPEINIRTTFIVGFPGETEEDILELEKFVAEGHFSHLGVFTYSLEEGTPSYEMDQQISEELKEERRGRIMAAQQGVVERRNCQLIGTTVEVLIDGVHEETELLLTGRARFQAPEVDGTVIVNDLAEALAEIKAGALTEVEITDTAGYDLIGKVVSVS